MTDQITGNTLKKAKRVVAVADSRRLVARLISTRQPVSQLQLCMIGVKVNLAKVGYQMHPDFLMRYIVPIGAPKTKEQLVEEMMDIVSRYSLAARNIPKQLYYQVRHNGRLIRRMASSD